MDQKKIGKFIAGCRREAGMTQQALSERLGVSDKTVGNWENGAEPSRPFPLQASLRRAWNNPRRVFQRRKNSGRKNERKNR